MVHGLSGILERLISSDMPANSLDQAYHPTDHGEHTKDFVKPCIVHSAALVRIELDIDGVKVHHPKPLEDRAKQETTCCQRTVRRTLSSLCLVAASGIAPEIRGYEPLVITVSLYRNLEGCNKISM